MPYPILPSTLQADGRHATSHNAYIDVKAHFGAVGDGVTDDTAAIQAAINAVGADGGVVVVPPSSNRYLCASSLNLSGKRSITLRGMGGLSAGAETAACLTYSGTGSQFINAQNTSGVWLEDISVVYSNAGFSGYLIDFRNVAGADTAFGGMLRCLIGGTGGVATAAACVALDKALSMTLRDSYISGAVVGVMGRSAAGTYSNRNLIQGCTFNNMTGVAIKNAGEAWSIQSCTFEPLVGGAAGAYTNDNGVPSKGLCFSGNWFGDVTGGGTHILFGGSGLSIVGNEIGGSATSTAIGFKENACTGITITGNVFNTHLNAVVWNVGGAGAHVATYVTGNLYTGVTNPSVGALGTPGLRDDGANLFTTSNLQIATGATISGTLAHIGNQLGFFNHASTVQPAAYTVTNPTTDRGLNVTADTLPQVAEVLGTLIADLQSLGLIG